MKTPLSIKLLGPLTVQRGEQELPLSAWRSRQEWRLLAILVAARGSTVSFERLTNWLWHGADPVASGVTLRSAVSSLRRTLEPGTTRASDRYIVTRPGGYAWNVTNGVWIDIDEFLACLAPLEETWTTTSLERAIELYRGDFLEDDPEALWALAERSRLRDRYLYALRVLVDMQIAAGAYGRAIELAQRGMEHNPLHEPLCRALMRIYAILGDTAAALQTYDTYRRALSHDLGATPSAPTRALHAAILRGEVADWRRAEETSADDRSARNSAIDIRSVGSTHPIAPFVGRERELAALRGWISDLGRDRGGIVTIAGEAGAGKSRLIAEALGAAVTSGAQSIELHCMPLDRNLPFAPLSEALRPLVRLAPELALRRFPEAALAQVADLLPVIRERLPDLPALAAVPPSENRNRLIDGLVDMALALARVTPLVISCDNAQSADDATLATLGRLARHAPRRAMLLLVAYRSEELAENPDLLRLLRESGREMHLRPLTLNRLDSAAITGWLATQAQLPPERLRHFAERLIASSGGNPFFLNSILQALLETHNAPSLAALLPHFDLYAPLPDPSGIPPIRDLILGRLERLPASARALLEQLAVIGRPVSLDQIDQIGGQEWLEAAQILLERQFLYEDTEGCFVFTHDLVRTAIIGLLSSPRRRLLQQQAKTMEGR